MKWDAVEREFVIIGNQLHKLATSFEVLACELHREREVANHAGNESDAGGATNKNKSGPEALSFPDFEVFS